MVVERVLVWEKWRQHDLNMIHNNNSNDHTTNNNWHLLGSYQVAGIMLLLCIDYLSLSFKESSGFNMSIILILRWEHGSLVRWFDQDQMHLIWTK